MRTIPICILLFATLFCKGQQQKISNSEFSLFDQSNLWSVLDNHTSEHGPTDPYSYLKSSWYKIGNDTTINDIAYKNLLKSTDPEHKQWIGSGCFRQDGDRVYFLNSGREMLLYDFGMAVGDIMESAIIEGFFYASRLDSVGDITLQNTVRKIYYLTEYPASYPDTKKGEVWIEGIGSITNGLLRQTMFGLTVGGWHDYQLLCFYQNEILNYKSEKYENCFYDIVEGIVPGKTISKVQAYPNPVLNELYIQDRLNIEEGYTLELYSVKGELVKTECLEGGSNLHRIDVSSLKSGVYVVRLISASGRYFEEVIIKE